MKQYTLLDNGLRIVTDHIEHVETVSLGAWFLTGSANEEEPENGLSHVLEHMAFKGTTTRSSYEISKSIEGRGGYLNAYTSREVTAYYARILKEDVTLASDVLCDILNDSVYDPEELEKEKNVILQEIGQTLDTPDDLVFDYFQEICYPDQSMGRSILGSQERVQSFTREHILTYMHRQYSTKNAVIAAAGAIDHDAFVERIQSLMASFKTHEVSRSLPPQYVGGDFRRHKDLEQVHMILGFGGVGYKHSDYYAQNLACMILGGGMSSRLFQEIREKRGLVYTIQAYASAHQHGGVMGVYAGTSAQDIQELLPVLKQELYRSLTTITQEELHSAKRQIKAGLLMGLESTSNRCERIAHQVLVHDRLIETQEIVQKIDQVTIEDVKQYLHQTITSKPTLTTLGPIQNVMDYDAFCSL